MGILTMVFYLILASIVAEAAVKLVRGHPAKEKEIKALKARVDELEQRLGDCAASLEETRMVVADESASRAELAERLDFTERILASGRDHVE